MKVHILCSDYDNEPVCVYSDYSDAEQEVARARAEDGNGFYIVTLSLIERPNTGMKADAAIALDCGEDCSTRGAAYA